MEPCQKILKQLNGDGAKLATLKPLSPESPKMEGIDTVFVHPPTDHAALTEFSSFVFGDWLKEKLEMGAYRPSPGIKVVGKGFEAINEGLDELKQGVSGVKLVVEV